ncbi:DeoR family fructose operon transcriptional repressor [Methylopila capsulata]|uniref:DeoR family fructose operon transcriptional repressor n=1 Tax=Methylopila capsulata TaxID=61654 RepID=A0A9W6IW13_9HYPH|nr:DeoR/GlpR family DNA-binding transcription regulator [Methylopila capsulata]MBM7852453.1 DeoR family fructose operon transcriptional repressor [Methylopila capsulata]GLK56662.1 DeoR family transcriptional regulator [Methylopila capsulata]
MRSKERRTLLLEALKAGEADVEHLARRFEVSASTVRRDLQRLADENAVRRTYGGAILASPASETSLGERLATYGEQKRAIARAALALVEDGDTLILDAGSTVAAFGRLLRGRRVRVVTNNLVLPSMLAEAPGVELVVLGGAVRPTSMGSVGPLAMEAMRRITADRVFMSADGVVAGRGLCEASLDQVALKSLMMEQGREVVVLAHAAKLGRADQSAWAALPASWTLVTDQHADREQVANLEGYGATAIVAA